MKFLKKIRRKFMLYYRKPIKTVGIIGGLGPETTSRFYMKVIYLCQEKNSLYRPPILIWSVPIAQKMEIKEITNGLYSRKFPELLINAAKKLESGGADFLVMPCNSSHTFINLIRAEIHIPILSIIETTVDYLQENNISNIGLISTLVTRKNKLYNKALISRGINFLTPEPEEQKVLNDMILKLTIGDYGEKERQALMQIIYNLKEKGVENVVLACAALAVLVSKNTQVKIHDTMEILAHPTTNKIFDLPPKRKSNSKKITSSAV